MGFLLPDVRPSLGRALRLIGDRPLCAAHDQHGQDYYQHRGYEEYDRHDGQLPL